MEVASWVVQMIERDKGMRYCLGGQNFAYQGIWCP